MPRRLLVRLGAVTGAVALVASPAVGTAAAQEPPPPVEATLERLVGSGAVGTVTCDPGGEAWITVDVDQGSGRFPIHGWGATGIIGCGPEPARFEVPLAGNGVLLPGPVQYRVSASSTNGVAEAVVGETTIRWPVSLDATRPDGGPHAIRLSPVAGRSETAPIALGTITCDDPAELRVHVGGWQRAGRHHLPLEGSEEVRCEGPTPFAIPFASPSAEVRRGLATVVVSAVPVDWSFEESDVSSLTRRVLVRSDTPEPEPEVEPDPDSPVRVTGVRRSSGQLEVDVTTPACLAVSASLEVRVQPTAVRVAGRWYQPALFAERAFANPPCHGEPATTTVRVPDTSPDDDLTVITTFKGVDPRDLTVEFEYANATRVARPEGDAGGS